MVRICDPHIHLWDLATGLCPGLEKPSTGFIGDNAPIARSYLLAEFLEEPGDDLEIAGAVHVEAFPTDPLQEVAALQAVAETALFPLGIVGNADLTKNDVADLLDQMRNHPMFRGIRQVVNQHDDPALTYATKDYLSDLDFARGFAELGKRGLTFDLQLYPRQAPAAARMAAADPNTRIILNHAGMWADRYLDGWQQWKSAIEILAARPNVYVKISGLGMFDNNWTLDSIRPLIYETLEAFGIERCDVCLQLPGRQAFWNLHGALAILPGRGVGRGPRRARRPAPCKCNVVLLSGVTACGNSWSSALPVRRTQSRLRSTSPTSSKTRQTHRIWPGRRRVTSLRENCGSRSRRAD